MLIDSLIQSTCCQIDPQGQHKNGNNQKENCKLTDALTTAIGLQVRVNVVLTLLTALVDHSEVTVLRSNKLLLHIRVMLAEATTASALCASTAT